VPAGTDYAQREGWTVEQITTSLGVSQQGQIFLVFLFNLKNTFNEQSITSFSRQYETKVQNIMAAHRQV